MPAGRQSVPSPSFALQALALLCGACWCLYTPLQPLPILLLIAIAALILVLLKRVVPAMGGARVALGLVVLSLAGYGYSGLRVQLVHGDRLADAEQPLSIRVVAQVEGLPRRDGDSLSLEARSLSSFPGLAAGSLLKLGWYRIDQDSPATLAPGDCAEFELSLRGSRGPANAAGWDPERGALLRRWAARGSIRSAVNQPCDGGRGLDRLRWSLAEQIDSQLPPGPPRASLKALTLGDTREFGDQQWEMLRRSGLSHLMAISGLHIGLLAAFGALLAGALYWIRPSLSARLPRPQAQAVLALLFAGSYAALAGFSLPTQRALVGLLAFLLARLLRRSLSVWSAFALALCAVLLVDPLAPLNAGFWLSFGAVAWLLYLFDRGGVPRPKWRSLLLAQGVLCLGLWPLTAMWFQQGSLIGPLLNLLVVPWVAMVSVPLCLLAVAALLVLPFAATPLLKLAAFSLDPVWWVMRQLQGWTVSTATSAPDLLAVLLALLAVAWLFAPTGTRLRWLAPLLWLPLLWPRVATPEYGRLQALVLDVGQGQAILLRTHSHSALIDAGPATQAGFDAGEALVVPNLRALGVNRLDLLLLSHADSDHAGGREAVVSAFAPRAQMAKLAQAEEGVDECLKGHRWDWDGVNFEILHPPEHFPYLGNESSCVLRVEDASGAVLLIPGDIGTIIEQRLVREQADRLAAQVLISPHHGSAGSSSAGFLQAVQPEVVIYSAGWGNRFKMPRSETLARVAEIEAEQWSTARSGSLELSSNGLGGFYLQTLRSTEKRPWRATDLGPLPAQ